MDDLERQLWRLTYDYWQVPERAAKPLIAALRASPCSRANVLRQRLVLCTVAVPTVRGRESVDASDIFTRTITPHFMMGLLHDLQVVGSLTPAQIRTIESSMLEVVSAVGQWKARP